MHPLIHALLVVLFKESGSNRDEGREEYDSGSAVSSRVTELRLPRSYPPVQWMQGKKGLLS